VDLRPASPCPSLHHDSGADHAPHHGSMRHDTIGHDTIGHDTIGRVPRQRPLRSAPIARGGFPRRGLAVLRAEGLSRWEFVAAAIAAIVTAAGGCRPGPQFAEVTGTVKIDGVPADGVQVAFEPQSEDIRKLLPAAYGMTNAEGFYRLLRLGRDPGAPTGLHHVRMTPVEQEGGKNTVIHPRYQENNSLWAEVQPGKNVIDFDLRSDPTKPAK